MTVDRRACGAYKLGAQLGTTSYAFINRRIKPSKQPRGVPDERRAVRR